MLELRRKQLPPVTLGILEGGTWAWWWNHWVAWGEITGWSGVCSMVWDWPYPGVWRQRWWRWRWPQLENKWKAYSSHVRLLRNSCANQPQAQYLKVPLIGLLILFVLFASGILLRKKHVVLCGLLGKYISPTIWLVCVFVVWCKISNLTLMTCLLNLPISPSYCW